MSDVEDTPCRVSAAAIRSCKATSISGSKPDPRNLTMPVLMVSTVSETDRHELCILQLWAQWFQAWLQSVMQQEDRPLLLRLIRSKLSNFSQHRHDNQKQTVLVTSSACFSMGSLGKPIFKEIIIKIIAKEVATGSWYWSNKASTNNNISLLFLILLLMWTKVP